MDVEKKIEDAMDYVMKNHSLIKDAHSKLGIPLEDCLASAIKKGLEDNEQNPKK